MATERLWSTGDSLSNLSAEFLNGLTEMWKDWKRNRPSKDAGAVVIPPETEWFVKNVSGGGLRQYSIVRLNTALVEPDTSLNYFFGKAVYESQAPAVGEKFAIIQQPAPEDCIVPVCMSGLSWVKVNITDAAHRYAAPTTSYTRLTSQSASGPALMLKQESGTGEKWALVLLDNRNSLVSAITSINGDTTAAQVFSVGTSGSNFAITDTGAGTLRWDLPDAGWAARGAVAIVTSPSYQALGKNKVFDGVYLFQDPTGAPINNRSSTLYFAQEDTGSTPVFAKQAHMFFFEDTFYLITGNGGDIDPHDFGPTDRQAYVRVWAKDSIGIPSGFPKTGGVSAQTILLLSGTDDDAVPDDEPSFAVETWNGISFDYWVGDWATVSGLVFKGGLYISGSITGFATGSGSASGTNTGDQLVFKTIAVSGQSDIVADTTTDTLTVAAGSGITITTDAGTDTLTIALTTPVTVANGGTGASTFTAYAVVCAGTTATGPFQNVSGVGTSGQVLTSNGAGALPTWQAASGAADGINVDVTGSQVDALTKTISPSLSSDQNDWNPTSFSVTAPTTTRLRINCTSAATITGIVAGAEGQIIILQNIGTNAITLANEDSGSSADNRFSINTIGVGSITLLTDHCAVFQYDDTSNRWRHVAGGVYKIGASQLVGNSTGASATVTGIAIDSTLQFTGTTLGVTGAGGAGANRTEGTLTATGSNQGDAAAIVTDAVEVSGADGTKGVILPNEAAAIIPVRNTAGSTLKVYPNSGAQIGSGGTNNAYSVLGNNNVVFLRTSSTQWITITVL